MCRRLKRRSTRVFCIQQPVPSLAFPAHQCKFIFLRKYNEQKKVMPGLGKSTQLIGSFFSALKTLYLQINSVYYSVFAAS